MIRRLTTFRVGPSVMFIAFAFAMAHTTVALAQSNSPHIEESTRAAAIQREREEKLRNIGPESNSRWEDRTIAIRDKKILERITAGVHGVRLKLGGLASGGGFAVGPEYSRNDLWDGRMRFRSAAQASLGGFQKYDVELTMPAIRRWLSWNVYSVHHNYPQLQYYGPGPDSHKTGRSVFRLEDTAVDTTVAIHPLRHFTLGVQSGYLQNNVGPGTGDRFISTDRQFTEAATPGIERQSNFARYGAFVQYDWRDVPGASRSGGIYYMQWSRYVDQSGGRNTHHRMDIEVQQFLPLFNARRVIALRGNASLTESNSGNQIPFYLQPVLGGSETLRGYRAFRFYGDQALAMTAEYRYEIFAGLDMAVFADAGKVATKKSHINFHDLESSAGFGFRVNARNRVFMRIDTAFSHEGWQLWIKFNDVFAFGPVKTSSSRGEF